MHILFFVGDEMLFVSKNVLRIESEPSLQNVGTSGCGMVDGAGDAVHRHGGGAGLRPDLCAPPF